MYKGGGLGQYTQNQTEKLSIKKDRNSYRNLKLGNPFLSLVKSTEREDGIMWNQVVLSMSCSIVAKAFTQQFPSL